MGAPKFASDFKDVSQTSGSSHHAKLDASIEYLPPLMEDIPDNWNREHFQFQDTEIERIVAHASDPVVHITVRGGLQGKVAEFAQKPLLNKLNELGCSIEIIPLPDPGKEIGFFPFYKELTYESQFNEKIRLESSKMSPTLVMPHSLSGLTTTSLSRTSDFLHRFNDKDSKFTDDHNSIILMSAFYASQHMESIWKQYAYRAYAHLNKDKCYGDTFLDKIFKEQGLIQELFGQQTGELFQLFNKVTNIPKIVEKLGETYMALATLIQEISNMDIPDHEKIDATHAQILYVLMVGDYERKMSREANAFPNHNVDISSVAGQDDFMAYKEFIRRMTKRMGGKFQQVSSEHDPLGEAPDEMEEIILSKVLEISGKHKQKHNIKTNPSRQTVTRQDLLDWAQSLTIPNIDCYD